MQEHERLNKLAIEAGKHVWSEKPIANSLEAGQKLLALAKEKKVRVWGAPTVVNSSQFAFMSKAISDGKLGQVAAAHATYGWSGPDWADFFYAQNGGSMPDLGVYNLTTLTGLLGPVKSVVAMTSILTSTRKATGKEPLFTPEQALHVVEIMTAARLSQQDGRRIALRSTFTWPVIA